MHITENQVKCVNVNDVQYVEKLYFPNFFAPSLTLTNVCLEDNKCTRFRLRRYIYIYIIYNIYIYNVNLLEFY